MKIKILQWNIWYQEKVENIIKLIKQINPDIICLQELTDKNPYNDKEDVSKIIAEQLNLNYNFAKSHTFENNEIQGNGIFSKFKIIKNSNFFIVEPKGNQDYSNEGRVCAVSTIKLNDNKTIAIATTHSSYNNKFIENKSKLNEINKLNDFFKTQKDNFIFTGDLNITPNSKSIKLIEQTLTHCGPDYNQATWTTKPFSYQGFEVTQLKYRLDYIFSTPDIKIISSKIIKTKNVK
ncbi:MAG: endonuclease/exonuclease/phosphatase family protein [Nanoarchaeales archaeon]|nr:endonuclease/exonuclease/phosphatase family protein [Nanoarchaeales archaeon]